MVHRARPLQYHHLPLFVCLVACNLPPEYVMAQKEASDRGRAADAACGAWQTLFIRGGEGGSFGSETHPPPKKILTQTLAEAKSSLDKRPLCRTPPGPPPTPSLWYEFLTNNARGMCAAPTPHPRGDPLRAPCGSTGRPPRVHGWGLCRGGGVHEPPVKLLLDRPLCMHRVGLAPCCGRCMWRAPSPLRPPPVHPSPPPRCKG